MEGPGSSSRFTGRGRAGGRRREGRAAKAICWLRSRTQACLFSAPEWRRGLRAVPRSPFLRALLLPPPRSPCPPGGRASAPTASPSPARPARRPPCPPSLQPWDWLPPAFGEPGRPSRPQPTSPERDEGPLSVAGGLAAISPCQPLPSRSLPQTCLTSVRGAAGVPPPHPLTPSPCGLSLPAAHSPPAAAPQSRLQELHPHPPHSQARVPEKPCCPRLISGLDPAREGRKAVHRVWRPPPPDLPPSTAQ